LVFVPIVNIFSLNYVSSQILHHLVGSFGLVLVAPCTAIIGGLMLVERQETVLVAEESAGS
jgi:uncharacterized membrane protein